MPIFVINDFILKYPQLLIYNVYIDYIYIVLNSIPAITESSLYLNPNPRPNMLSHAV